MKKEWIIVAVLALAALGYLFLRSDKQMGYKAPKWDEITQEDIEEIRFDRDGETHRLIPGEEQWTLSEPARTASAAKVDPIVSAIGNMAILDRVSEGENYQRFLLEEDQLFKLWVITADEERELWLGKASSAGGGTYLRLPEEEGVFVLSGDWNSLIPAEPWDLRDNLVLAPMGEISTIRFISAEREVEMTLQDDGWYENGQFYIDQDSAGMFQQQFSTLRCDSFIRDSITEEPLVEIQVETQPGQVQWLKIYSQADQGYRATSSMSEDAFTLSSFIVEDWIAVIE